MNKTIHIFFALLLMGSSGSGGGLSGGDGGAAAPAFANTKSTLFAGTDDVVVLGTPAGLRPNLSTTEFTVSLWFKTASLATQQYVAAHAEPFAGGGADMNWVLGINTDGSAFGYFGAVGKTAQSAASEISAGNWYHYAFTVRDISGTMTGNLWLGGVKQGSDVTSPGTDTTITRTARIGAGYVLDGPDTALPFNGDVDEVCVFSVGLTQAEVQALASSNKPTDCSLHSRAANLDFYYRMGDGDTFPIILDHQLNEDGTCTNMVDAATNFVNDVP